MCIWKAPSAGPSFYFRPVSADFPALIKSSYFEERELPLPVLRLPFVYPGPVAFAEEEKVSENKR